MLNFQVTIHIRFTYSCGRPKSVTYILIKIQGTILIRFCGNFRCL